MTALKPYRMAFVYLMENSGKKQLNCPNNYYRLWVLRKGIYVIAGKGLPEIQTSSCGRLFDAVASMLGVCDLNKYEGQAAVELESLADPLINSRYGLT